jgi:hypothetical protein
MAQQYSTHWQEKQKDCDTPSATAINPVISLLAIISLLFMLTHRSDDSTAQNNTAHRTYAITMHNFIILEKKVIYNFKAIPFNV